MSFFLLVLRGAELYSHRTIVHEYAISGTPEGGDKTTKEKIPAPRVGYCSRRSATATFRQKEKKANLAEQGLGVVEHGREVLAELPARFEGIAVASVVGREVNQCLHQHPNLGFRHVRQIVPSNSYRKISYDTIIFERGGAAAKRPGSAYATYHM